MMSLGITQKKLLFFGYPIRLVLNKNATNSEIHDCVWQSVRRLIKKDEIQKYDRYGMKFNSNVSRNKGIVNDSTIIKEEKRKEGGEEGECETKIERDIQISTEKETETETNRERGKGMIEKPYDVVVGTNYGNKVERDTLPLRSIYSI